MGTSDTDDESIGKPFPGYDFDTFDGCVTAFSDEEGIDDPEAFCAWLDEEGAEALSDPGAEEILTGLEVEFVSAVDEPAQDSEWVIAKDATDPEGDRHRWQSSTTLYVRKDDTGNDDVKQVAFAPVLIPKEADKQGDVIPKPAIEDAAHKYLAEYRKVDSDHDLRDGKGTPVESWTLKQDTTFEMPDGSESREYPKGTWVMGIKFDDETWERVVSGELDGLSIYGGAKPVDVDALLGKQTDAIDRKAEAKQKDSDDGDRSSETETTNMGDDDTPDESGNEPDDESTSKQEFAAEDLTAALSQFRDLVEEGSIGKDATVKDFVTSLLQDGRVDEANVKGLSVFLADDDGDMMEDEEDDEDDEGDDDVDIDLDDDAGKDADGDDTDDEEDEEDVGKSADFDDAPEWAQALKSEVEDLRKKVDDPPEGDRMEPDELGDRIVKDVFGVDDPDVARKAIQEQVEKSDESAEIDFDGITDDEDADADASDGGGSLHSAAANKRMVGGND